MPDESQGPPSAPALSRLKQRRIEAATAIAETDPEGLLFQHSVFCQTSLPYRDPGELRLWERSQGAAHLRIEAGAAFHPEQDAFVEVGLPFGTKPRLILAYLNAQALRTGSPEIEVDKSLTAFVRRLRLRLDGRTILTVKDQLTRLATANVRLALAIPGTPTRQVQSHIVGGFELWLPKDEQQRVIWPSTVQLSFDYFTSLRRHAVPLDERALAALANNAMALDIYAWLSQRLHRIDPGRTAFVPWPALQAQFGWRYCRVRKFRETFRPTLALVRSHYPAAQLALDARGMTLFPSPPPIKHRLAVVRRA
jgi:hypothetical protein